MSASRSPQTNSSFYRMVAARGEGVLVESFMIKRPSVDQRMAAGRALRKHGRAQNHIPTSNCFSITKVAGSYCAVGPKQARLSRAGDRLIWINSEWPRNYTLSFGFNLIAHFSTRHE